MGIIYFLIVYYPLHEFFLKITGLSGPALFIARQWPELAIIITFFAVAYQRAIHRNIFIYKKGVSPWLLLFLIWGIFLSISITGNSLSVAFSEIFVLLRFTLVFATVFLINPNRAQSHKLINLVMISIFIQAIIASAQFFGGEPVLKIFKPVDYESIFTEVQREFTSNRVGAERVLIGTAGDFVSLSYLIALGIFIVYLSKSLFFKGKIILALLFILLFFCGSRTVFLGTVIVVLSFNFMSQRAYKKLFYSLIFVISVIPAFLFVNDLAGRMDFEYSNFISLFDSRIFESLINQRLGVLLFVVPNYLSSGDFLIGFSPDRFHIANVVQSSYIEVPNALQAVLQYVLEDIYPLALFLYYGIVGFSFLVIIFFKLFNFCYKVRANIDPFVGGLGLMVLASVVIFSLGNQSLENRIFSFYFWLIMGINVSLFNSGKFKNARPPHS